MVAIFEGNIIGIEVGAGGETASKESYFVVENSCGEVVTGNWFRDNFVPKPLRVYFKRLDDHIVGKLTKKNLNLVETIDTKLNKVVTLDLQKIPEEYSRHNTDENGVNLTVLLLRYLKLDSDREVNIPHRLDLKPGEIKRYDFGNKGPGTYLVFFGTGEDNVGNDRWYFRRVVVKKRRKYTAVYRQEISKENGLSPVTETKL